MIDQKRTELEKVKKRLTAVEDQFANQKADLENAQKEAKEHKLQL